MGFVCSKTHLSRVGYAVLSASISDVESFGMMMTAAMKMHKEGELVVIEIEDWDAVGMIDRYEAAAKWARESDLKGIRTVMQVEVPKEHFVELMELWSQGPLTEDELAEYEKWLQRAD